MDLLTPRLVVPLRLVGGEGHYEAVVGAVRAARTSVWIGTANLKELMVREVRSYRSVLAVFDELARRGVELRILHAALPSRAFRESFDRYPRLVRGGLELRLCPRVHFKVVVVDGELLYIGSANWTGAGLGVKASGRRNFELGIITRDPALLDQIQPYYDHIWRGRACGGCKRRDLCEAPLDT